MPSTPFQIFGDRLREWRLQRGLTQGQVAERGGFSEVGYRGWESGRTSPSTLNLYRLSKAMGVHIDFLRHALDECNSPLVAKLRAKLARFERPQTTTLEEEIVIYAA